jgi:hypothetical protein
MITYLNSLKGIAVYADNKLSGYIVAQLNGFMYIPKGYKQFSYTFGNLADLKKSLEN